MSTVYANNVVVPWINDNRWPQSAGSDDLLVISVPSAASANGPVYWNSGVSGLFEVYTYWDRAQERLNKTSLYIEVPGFGPVVLFSDKTINLKSSKPIMVDISGGGVYGNVQFVYGNTEKKDIKLNWDINVPWFGHFNDGRSLFPAARSSSFLDNKLQNVKVITDSEVSALKEAPLSEFNVVTVSGKELIQFATSREDEHQQSVATSFIHDNIGAGNPIVILPVLSSSKSEGNTLDISILGILQLVGTIFIDQMVISAILYVKIPFIGRVQLVEIKGTLITGIEVSIDLALAKGSVQVSAKNNASGRHDLYINPNVEIKFLRKFDTGDMKLLTLPF